MGLLRSILLYVAWFFVCVVIIATAFESLPDWLETLIVFVAPVFIVKWLNGRRRERQEKAKADTGPVTSAAPPHVSANRSNGQVPQTMPGLPNSVDQLRTARRLARSKIRNHAVPSFGRKQKSTFQETASSSKPIPARDEDSFDPGFAPVSRMPRQDNAQLIAAGRAARGDLWELAKKYAKPGSAEKPIGIEEREEGPSEKSPSPQNAFSGPILSDRPKTVEVHAPAVQDLHSMPPKQDNKTLIAAGQAARADLERPALKYAKHPQSTTSAYVQSDREEALASSGREARREASKGRSGWVPAGQEVIVAGRRIPGMVYVGTPPRLGDGYYRGSSRAHIVPSLPVAEGRGNCRADELGYWPDYSEASPSCRAAYLDWLASGAQDPLADTGFVFLYFYGLERRMFLDDPDLEERQLLIAEAKRLQAVYGLNHSVTRYVGDFIEAATIVTSDAYDVEPFFETHGWELPLRLRVKIGALVRDDERLSADWLLSWYMCSGYVGLRTPARRCPEEFRAMFRILFAAKHPNGLKVRKPSTELSWIYRAASSEFEKQLPLLVDGVAVPDISTIGGPLNKAQLIADGACDALDAYSRYLGRNPDARGTIEAHALLPQEIATDFPCEAMDELRAWVGAVITNGGLIPVAQLIERLVGSRPSQIGKRQLIDAADLLSGLGVGIAPDPRFALRAPKASEPVVLFDLGETSQNSDEVSDDYKRILLEMALGCLVAHADGTMVEAERERLIERANTAPVANNAERLRLQANRLWFETVKPDIKMLRAALKKADESEILVLRAAAISMAYADMTVVPEEVEGIEKIYKILGLDRSLVYADLHSRGAATGPVAVRSAVSEIGGEIITPGSGAITALDMGRIAEIRSDTQKVSSVLAGIFNSNQAEPNIASGSETEHSGSSGKEAENETSEAGLAGLDAAHRSFAASLLSKASWSKDELSALAASAGLPLAGMIETVNEWSFEEHGEMLIDDYDGYEVIAETAGLILTNSNGTA